MGPSLDAARAKVVELNKRYLSGKPDAFDATLELLNLLLGLTVMAPGQSLRYTKLPSNPNTRLIGDVERPVLLNDGRYLRVLVSMKLEDDKDAKLTKLRVYNSSFQYQHDAHEERWILRYDYVRNQTLHHPSSHLQVAADLTHNCLPGHRPFNRVHLPTARISAEAVIRLLADQFDIPCHADAGVWRPVLAEAERQFNKICHKPLSGPEA